MESDSKLIFPENQRGRGNIGCLFSFLLLGVFVYVGYKFVPPYVNNYQLKDALDELAVYEVAGTGVSKRGTVMDTQEKVISKAKGIGIQLERKNIKIERMTDKIFIHVNYSIPVDLPSSVYQLNFDFTSHN